MTMVRPHPPRFVPERDLTRRRPPAQIHIPDCDAGWLPTQHVHLRIFAGGARILESHAFTITNAPASAHTGGAVVGTSSPGAGAGATRGITLYAKVAGDWTRGVNALAREPGYKLVTAGGEDDEDDDEEGVLVRENVTSVRVLLSGPYGGLKLDMASYRSVLLIAGGSGITFMLGCVEECLTRKRALCVAGREGDGPRKVECVWVVRDMSESVLSNVSVGMAADG